MVHTPVTHTLRASVYLSRILLSGYATPLLVRCRPALVQGMLWRRSRYTGLQQHEVAPVCCSAIILPARLPILKFKGTPLACPLHSSTCWPMYHTYYQSTRRRWPRSFSRHPGRRGWIGTAASPVAPVGVARAVLGDAAAKLNGAFRKASAAIQPQVRRHLHRQR